MLAINLLDIYCYKDHPIFVNGKKMNLLTDLE